MNELAVNVSVATYLVCGFILTCYWAFSEGEKDKSWDWSVQLIILLLWVPLIVSVPVAKFYNYLERKGREEKQ
jgi:heme/copper-type cytochrome/quinol oxidase subunit 2